MRTLLFLLQKEFLQIFRDRIILAMILIMPTMQLILLPLAANYEVRHIGVSIVDHDRSAMSHQLIMKITNGPTDPSMCIDFTDWEDVKQYAKHISELAHQA